MDVISHLLTLLRRSEWHSYDRDRGYHGQYHIRALVWGGGVSISFHFSATELPDLTETFRVEKLYISGSKCPVFLEQCYT